MVGTILVVIALVLAVLAALNVPARGIALGWASLAFYFASILLGGLKF
jgi:hypothetical protein